MKNKLDILYMGTLPPHPGGSAIACSQMIIALARVGHSIRTLAPIADLSEDTFAKNHREINVTRYIVPYYETTAYIPTAESLEYRKLEGQQIKEKMKVLIEEKRPDIIIIGRETFAWHVPDIAISYHIPCMLLIHSGPTQGIIDGTYPDELAQSLLDQYKKVNVIISPARHLAEGLNSLGSRNVRIILNTVDPDQFAPRPKNKILERSLNLKKGEIVVLHASNLKPLKRPLDIVNSAELALRQNRRLVYVIVGDGKLRGEMEELCKSRNIIDNFRFVGWVDYNLMPEYINLADIVVMPSKGEGLALVYLETQACARLLVASDIAAAREVIVHGETGLLFRMGDIDDLTEKTLLAAGDDKLRSEIGRKGREYATRAHSIDDALAKYASTIKEVIQQHRDKQASVSGVFQTK